MVDILVIIRNSGWTHLTNEEQAEQLRLHAWPRARADSINKKSAHVKLHDAIDVYC